MKHISCVYILLVLFLCSGCSGELKNSATKVDSYDFGISTPVQTLDSTYAVDATSLIVLNNVLEGLYRMDENEEAVPAVAEELPEISEDGLQYSIKLKKDLLWNDGVALTADDFIFAWKKVISSSDSQNIDYFKYIKNGKSIISNEADIDSLGVFAADSNSLIIELEEPTPYFTSLLSTVAFFPQREDIVKKYGAQYGTNAASMVYNGAFVLDDLDEVGITEDWILKKSDNYWDAEQVEVNQLNMSVVQDVGTGVSLFENGKLDDVPLSGEYAKQFRTDKNFVSEKSDSALLIEINHENIELQNVHLRKALSYAIDREALVNNVVANGSTGLTSIVTDSLKLSDSSLIFYDIEMANEEFEKAKADLDIDEISLDILTSDQDLGKKAAEFIQGQLEELEGLNVTITPIPANVQFEKLGKKDFDLSLSGIGADYPDAYSLLNSFVTDGPVNHGAYSNIDYDELLEKSLTETGTDRDEVLKKAENIINDDLGAIPLIQLNSARLRNVEMEGIVVHSTGAKYDFKNLKLR